MKKRPILAIYLIVFSPIVIFFIILLLIGSGAMGFMPGFEDLENPKSNIASQVISEDNIVLGGYFIENRTYATFDELSPHLVTALLATEDYRFEKHAGIDAKALFRVFVGVMTGTNKGGGSTITQQLAKNLFPRDTAEHRSSIGRMAHLSIAKFKEWVTAVKLERNYTKKEIMVMYLNTVSFGGNAFGIRSASRTFFNKSPKTLKVEEAAVLVGLLKAPSMYNPVRNAERSTQRRNVVMSQMVKYGYLSKHDYDSLSSLPIELDYNLLDHTAGRATYFREMLRMYISAENPYERNYRNPESFERDAELWDTDPLFGWCNKNFKPDGSKYDLYRDGLKICTTINSKMQEYAEDAVFEHLAYEIQPAFRAEKRYSKTAPYSNELTPDEVDHIIKLSIRRSERYRVLNKSGMTWDEILENFNTKTEMRVFSYRGDIDTVMSPLDSIKYYKHFLHCGFMAMDHHSGEIKAYVGGINYKHFKYDAVKSGKRQVGSTFKPFLYTLAMQEGYTPCYEVPNVPVTFLLPTGDTWTPQSSGSTKYDRQMVTLKWGLANSENNISAWLMQQFKPKAVIDVVKLMGINSYIPEVPSICLGSADISLYEMVGAYGTFANKGIHVEPIFVTKIEDRNGNVLSTFSARKNEAISKNAAYLMIDLLKSVVNQGTSVRLRLKYELYGEIAAKTGTTNNHSDGWFMALVPKLTCGVWVGGEERSIHFDNLSIGQGANMALPVFALFIKKVYADPSLNIYPTDTFEKPETINYSLDCGTKDDNIDIYEDEFFN
ncbi:MAG TPA: transglycosylase domain-containing protein [Salinivirgaceae bacterium]|nr:transglycosylase domain-containing protein [Salinivirgaceae bacterium]HQA76067.1 transglycosylase domain-containing protein [Salinivirgaceae bacterium]